MDIASQLVELENSHRYLVSQLGRVIYTAYAEEKGFESGEVIKLCKRLKSIEAEIDLLLERI